DRFAELSALPGVSERRVERALRDSYHLRADADSPLIERFDRDLVALARFAENVRGGHPALVQQQLARAARSNTELVFLLPNRETGEARFDDERGDTAMTGRRVDRRQHDED